MNLHGLAVGAIGIVNPFISGTWQASSGSFTNPDGSRTPAFAAPIAVQLQVQALAYGEIQLLDGLNIQGDARAVYMSGNVDGVNRLEAKGGDLLNFNGSSWLVTQPLETWPDWCKLLVVRQT